jgi:hypothetical protein
MRHRVVCLAMLSAVCVSAVYGQCTAAPESRKTYWGHENAVTIHSQPLKRLHGTVTLGYATPQLPKDGVLVEVFDRPDLAQGGDPNRTGQKRLFACITSKDGKFSFDLPPGKYELRSSRPTEWNSASDIVTISHGGSSVSLRVRLRLAE